MSEDEWERFWDRVIEEHELRQLSIELASINPDGTWKTLEDRIIDFKVATWKLGLTTERLTRPPEENNE